MASYYIYSPKKQKKKTRRTRKAPGGNKKAVAKSRDFQQSPW
jgi:hypothetical protein